jgi:hypothetical protein
MRVLRTVLFAFTLPILASCARSMRDARAPASALAIAGGEADSPHPFVCDHSPCDQSDATRALDAAMRQCSTTQNVYEKDSKHSRAGQFALAVVGALSGAGLPRWRRAPVLRAWAGLSGATNGLQAQLGEQFSASKPG